MGFDFMALALLVCDGLSFREAREGYQENRHAFQFSLYFSNSMHYYRFFMYHISTEQGAFATPVHGEALCVFCLAW